MRGIRDILIFALCLLLAMAPAVDANSAPTSWEGAEGTGAMILDKDCPIEVVGEVLTFDIQQFPEEYYSTVSTFDDYSATVTAEYTFHNPTDSDVTATLLFPYGLMPDYVNVYAEETGQLIDEIESQCGVWIDGEAVEVIRRASLHESGTSFETKEVERLHNGFLEHDFYHPDMTVIKYTYYVTGVDHETYDAADWGTQIRNDPNIRKIFSRDFDGWGVKGDYVLVHGGVGHRKDPNAFAVYVIGEPMEEIDWKIYENGACEKVIEGNVELAATETMTLLEFTLEHWQEKYGISPSDWYNAVVQAMARREFAQGCIESDAPMHMAQRTMRWYQYELTVPAGETVVNTVTAPIYPDINSAWEPSIYTYTYLLSPAKGWADFGTLEIRVNTPFHVTQCNLDGFEKTSEGYELHLDGLPDRELEFAMSTVKNPGKPGTHFKQTLLLTLGTAALIVGGIIRIRKRKNG